MKKIKIERVKENEYKKKREYGWCASKEKNTDLTWEVPWESGHDGVYHHTRPQHSVNNTRHDLAFHASEHLCCVMGNDGCSLD